MRRMNMKKTIKYIIGIVLFIGVFFTSNNEININAVELDQEYDILTGLYITVDDSIALKLRENYFEGYITFEYLDEGLENFKIYTDTHRPSEEGGDYSIIASINKGDTGEWKQGKVRVYKENTQFTHQAENNSDFIFKGDAKVRNISFDFDIFSIQ